MEISGLVLVEPGHPATADAVLRVRLLDVSMLDAPSVVLAETVVRGVAHLAGEETAVPFRLHVDGPLPRGADLSLDAHLAVPPVSPETGGRVKGGDLVTTTSTPVRPGGTHGLLLRLRQIG